MSVKTAARMINECVGVDRGPCAGCSIYDRCAIDAVSKVPVRRARKVFVRKAIGVQDAECFHFVLSFALPPQVP